MPEATPRARRPLAATPALAGAICALVLGCTAPPDPPRDLPQPPQAWDGAHADGPLRDDGAWWRDFDAPQMHAFIERALAHNLDLRAAVARVEAAAAVARAVTGERLPQLQAALDLSRSRRNFLGFPIPGGSGDDVFSVTTDEHRLGVSAAWELDLWGRLAAAEDAARADYRATEEDARAARASIAARTARAWLAWSDAHRQWRIAEAERDVAAESARLARLRFDAGTGPAGAVDATAAALARAEAAVAERAQAVRERARALRILTGRYPGGVAEEPAALPPLPEPVPAGVPADVIARRPDLRAAEARAMAAAARGEEARAALYPSLSLTGALGTSSTELEDLLDGDFRVWSLGAGLTAPLFQGGRLRAGADAAAARQRAAELEFAQRALTAWAEVEAALDGEQRIRARLRALQDARAREQDGLGNAEARFRSGTGDALAVLEARAAVERAEARVHAARRMLLENRIALHLALGGRVPQETPSPTPDSRS